MFSFLFCTRICTCSGVQVVYLMIAHTFLSTDVSSISHRQAPSWPYPSHEECLKLSFILPSVCSVQKFIFKLFEGPALLSIRQERSIDGLFSSLYSAHSNSKRPSRLLQVLSVFAALSSNSGRGGGHSLRRHFKNIFSRKGLCSVTQLFSF